MDGADKQGKSTSRQGTVSLSLSIRPALSHSHLISAAYFARRAGKLERREPDTDITDEGERFYVHKAYVTGAVLYSVAFLEAEISEQFSVNRLHSEPLTVVWHQLLSGKSGVPTLKKYQVFLRLAGKPLFNTGDAPYQDVDVLIRLRNDLIHGEQLNQVIQQTDGSGKDVILDIPVLEKKLRGKFLKMNPLEKPGLRVGTHFLDVYLGYGCACWAVEGSIAFADAFYNMLGWEPPYEKLRPVLKTE